MSETADFLFELGTEELPPSALDSLSAALEKLIVTAVGDAGLEFDKVSRFATPRRLAVQISNLSTRQADRDITRRGPAVSSAFDESGAPTKAALGFAKSCGVEVSDLERITTDKGEWLGFHATEQGKPTAELLPEIIENAIGKLPTPKRMRWGDSDKEFVRPVHWIVLMLGEQVVPLTLYGVTSGAATRGHRFHTAEPITLGAAADYEYALVEQGNVIPRIDARKERIRALVDKLGSANELNVVIEDDLLDEVTALVEWPVALFGTFDKEFLDVPQEALIAVMRDHQKYFHVVDDAGKLRPFFVTITNIESRDPEVVVKGNERVIYPRLADAKFFFDKDRTIRLADRLPRLANVVYQNKLGSLAEKTERVSVVADELAQLLGIDRNHVAQAARLSRCDLVTDLVYEFPELQGVAGKYYATHDGEPAPVADAIEEFYLPRFATDSLPPSAVGQVLAIADRIDTLVGIFGIGMVPSGDKDPFALRRATLGLVRIAIEQSVDFNLPQLVTQSVSSYKGLINQTDIEESLIPFILERLKNWYLDRGFDSGCIDAVAANPISTFVDFNQRLIAVASFSELDDAGALAAANKRISNILKKSAGKDASRSLEVDPALFESDAERNLHRSLEAIAQETLPLLEHRDYQQALRKLATLRDPVDSFFDDVMVMAEDEAIRKNRIALLSSLNREFLRIADISLLGSTN